MKLDAKLKHFFISFSMGEEVDLHPPVSFRRKSVEDIFKNSTEFLSFEDLSVGNFFSDNFMVPLKDAKNKPGWKPEYRDLAQVKRMHICKSCKCKARKGCCPEYSSGNRVMIKMIVGWNF
jgi:hypothetical protein